ncbi:MAG: DUF1934 domain-containing protein [Butyricicoccus sp.]|nr:DUF1934 domain-containing protein [Butyricicoccus sp.]
MKKNVLLSIASTQQFEGCEPEHIDLMTEAKLYERNGKYYITYEETELTGLEGTRTMVKMDGTTVSMIRTGTYPSELLFAEDQRHVGLYQTEFGALTISTHTSRLDNTIGENGGVLEIEYTIEVDNSMVGHHRFRMTVVPAADDEA